jgi:hypothetical protein
MLNLGENSASDSYSVAVQLRRRGWSVIPLRGDSDPARPKAAALRWSQFQRRLPTDAEITNWFAGQPDRALAVVCGSVSRLAVLDFDDPQLAESFAAAHPDLV